MKIQIKGMLEITTYLANKWSKLFFSDMCVSIASKCFL